MAFKVSAVSISVSPFLRELASIDKFMTLAPNLFPANSKLAWVRVEFSKNILIWVSPVRASALLSCDRFNCT